ncbi:MAG: hypothetical protein AVDCRST_MAG33-3028 [uncultured Thermomicrobiales bacterium]|uniref:N-acetyltransferase domain-containing protein n=1 Tax=uncultured Thermomicrobiales bacterium TaxID=1645740 RepID=A0A6J4VD56_9BACT|nr:MAG: hypothetical protein AVDCRST_MAG33-3028 [uncultured Thermomicrobiales bacterium]
MMDTITFGPPRGEADLLRFARLSEYAFWDEPAAQPGIGWLDTSGGRVIRLARRGETVIGGALVIPAGQWFGGRPVSAALIGAVSVAPEHRSGGVGSRLVADYLRAARDLGLAISTLYPASYAVYHRTGYEHAGTNLRYDLSVGALPVVRAGDGGITVREHAGDTAALRAAYARQAAITAGQIERPEEYWSGVFGESKRATHRYVAEQGGEVVGYLVFTQRVEADGTRVIEVRDLVATSRSASRALLGFLAAHRGNVDTVRLWAGANDHRLLEVGGRGLKPTYVDPWMLRILDVSAALSARGYPASVTAELHLDYRDDLLPENTGHWLVRIAGGRAEVTQGGDGHIRATARGLSGLFSGAYTAGAMADPVHLDAPDADLAALTAVFAGPAPWMDDHF